MSKMTIWHKVRGGAEVSTIVPGDDKTTAPVAIKKIKDDGGFFTDTSFVPWDSITYIEFEKAPEPLVPLKPTAPVAHA